MAAKRSVVLIEHVEKRILLLREQKVMLNRDLAELYSVETKTLNRAVKRNQDRFPGDFMFQLTVEEAENLRYQNGTSSLKSQFVTSNARRIHGGRRYLPYAFTEQGVAMLSSVLRSKRAVMVNVEIMRAYAAAWPERQIVQALLAQLTWYHHIALLARLDSTAARGRAGTRSGGEHKAEAAKLDAAANLKELGYGG